LTAGDASAARLADGSHPATSDALLARLGKLGIETRTYAHAAVFTVEEAQRVRGDLPGGHTKNLFVRDKRGTMWLLCCEADQSVDLRTLASRLGASGRLSFGSTERLMRYLGVRPGAVSPFAVINDHGQQVRVVLDPAVLGAEPINMHPLDNTRTTAIAAAGLLTFLDAEGHPPTFLDFRAS
jgi:Ala-tRNA(Pro) deacylase